MFVRLALERDFPAIVELSRLNAAESMAHHRFVPERVEAVLWRYIATANPTIFVVEHKREVVAFLKATMSEYDFTDGLYTTQEVLFVRPDMRGTRAAVLLTRELVRWSDSLGAKEITGGNDNDFRSERTARFLAHFGFERVGFFMRKRLRPDDVEEGR